MGDKEYRAMIEAVTLPYFKGTEILPIYPNRRRNRPPENQRENILTTLQIAVELRKLLGLPMNVVAAYRKTGGAPSSKHMTNHAIDLDLVQSARSPENIVALAEASREIFHRYGVATCMGMGHYVRTSWRVHIDTMCRSRRVSWYYGHDGSKTTKHHPTVAMAGAAALL